MCSSERKQHPWNLLQSPAVANAFGKILFGAGLVIMFVVWVATTVAFFSRGDTVLGLIALVVPPADLVLPFLISPLWGIGAIGGLVIAFAGSAMQRD